MTRITLLMVCSVLGSGCLAADDDAADETRASVNDVMINVITPASNTLWEAQDPQSDTEWQALADAAQLILDAAAKIRKGGSGPNDDDRSADPAWQAYVDTLAGAAADAQKAATEHDLDALFIANDVLYPPCEECHIEFHPGVSGEDLN